jgi:hypothetical protein
MKIVFCFAKFYLFFNMETLVLQPTLVAENKVIKFKS